MRKRSVPGCVCMRMHGGEREEEREGGRERAHASHVFVSVCVYVLGSCSSALQSQPCARLYNNRSTASAAAQLSVRFYLSVLPHLYSVTAFFMPGSRPMTVSNFSSKEAERQGLKLPASTCRHRCKKRPYNVATALNCSDQRLECSDLLGLGTG